MARGWQEAGRAQMDIIALSGLVTLKSSNRRVR